MAQKLTIAAFLLMGGATGVALSKLALPFTRMQSTLVHVILVSVAGIFLFYLIAKLLRERFPETVFGKSLQDISTELAVFSIAVLGASFMTKTTSVVHFYVDNGTTAPVTFITNGKDNYTVQPGQSVDFKLPTGSNTLNVDGRDTLVDLSENRGYYVYNVKGEHAYFLGSIYYGAEQEGQEKEEDLNLITGVLIHANADYMFEAPEQIFVKKRGSAKSIQKKVLYRVKDLLQQIENEEGMEAPAGSGN